MTVCICQCQPLPLSGRLMRKATHNPFWTLFKKKKKKKDLASILWTFSIILKIKNNCIGKGAFLLPPVFRWAQMRSVGLSGEGTESYHIGICPEGHSWLLLLPALCSLVAIVTGQEWWRASVLSLLFGLLSIAYRQTHYLFLFHLSCPSLRCLSFFVFYVWPFLSS